MDENHQGKTGSKLAATEDELHPVSSSDQKGPDRPQSNRMKMIKLWLGFFGYVKETKEYTPDGQLAKITKEYQPGKTFWDWLQLVGVLLIPLVIFLATMRFNQQQADLAQQQHNADQQRAQDQQRQITLETYLDNMRDLLLNKGLLTSKPGDTARVIARVETLSAMRQLDSKRNSFLVQFLQDAGLLGKAPDAPEQTPIQAIIDFLDANLSDIDLSGADLNHTHFHLALLTGANLTGANFTKADLSDAYLLHAHLVNATFAGANLAGANLAGANLAGANFYKALLTGADFYEADLGGADLIDADLSDVRNLTQQQLDQVYTCIGTILPKGLICHHNNK